MISIIIPAYNAEKTICRCLESALDQEAEIILADDGSTDATLRLAEKYGERVHILRLPHGGVSAARNAGLDAARGEWVVFLDSDDALLPGALDRLRPTMTDDVDAVCGTICRGNETPRLRGREAICLTGHALMDYVLADPTNCLTVHAWAFRIRPDMPRFDPDLRIGEDSDWVLRCLYRARQVVFIPAPVYRYTISADSTVHKWREDQEKDFLKMLKKLSLSAAGNEKNWPLFVLTNYLLILTHVVFHPANPNSRKKQLQAAEELRENPLIADAFDRADLRQLSRAKHVVLACLKRGWIGPAWVAVKVRQRMNATHSQTEE